MEISTESELYAGGDIGLAVFAKPRDMPAYRTLLSNAEQHGWSGLLTANVGELSVLTALGTKAFCIVADNSYLDEAVNSAIKSACGALCLIAPRLPNTESGRQAVSKLRLPRLYLAGSLPHDVLALQAFGACSAGPFATRTFPVHATGASLAGETSGLVAETILLFASRFVKSTSHV